MVVCRKLPLTIESTFAYGMYLFSKCLFFCFIDHFVVEDDYILVGTKEGHLLMYKLDIKSKTPSGKNKTLIIDIPSLVMIHFW